MRKIVFILLSAIALIACEGPEGPMGPRGADGQNGQNGKDGQDGKDGYGTEWYTTSFTINKSDWILSGQAGGLNTYFYADKKIPELSEFVFDEGTVLGYIQTDVNVKNGMPFVLHLGDEQNGQEFLWTQTYDFDFSPGMVRFYITYSDFNTQIPPESETFHIVLMW